jgi:hypothetical protein
MGTFGIALISTVFAFFAVLAMKTAYFLFVVEKMLRDANTDWRAEAGLWNETKQVRALAKACPDDCSVSRNATVLFRVTLFLFFAPVTVLVVGFILGM